MTVRHAVLMNPRNRGFPFGVLRHLEAEIVRLTGAEVVPIPRWRAPKALRDRLAHGTRYGALRRLVPRVQHFDVRADVAWAVLMGAEETDLDLLAGWEQAAS